jgi:hypothetical protein
VDKAAALLRENLEGPSLPFKGAGRFWSALVGVGTGTLVKHEDGDVVWVWIGKQAG